MDHQKIKDAVRMILEAVGEDPDREGLRDTPRRVAEMYEEILAGNTQDAGRFLDVTFEEHHKEMVVLQNIPLHSLCEHHMLPFSGQVHIGYIPRGRIVGVSKLARLTDMLSRRLQVQERLTSQIADALMERLNPLGCGVVVEAEHFCMIMRGIQRPGSAPVPPEEELRRVVPVVERLAAEVPLPISVDTYRATVAEAALRAGAHIINDITGFREDPAILDVAARHGAAVIAMHIQGRPATMQQNPTYTDLLGEVIAYLRESVAQAVAAGVPRERIWVDPGIGFGKTLAHNLELLRRLGELRVLDQPILIGTSRKGFIGRLLGGVPPAERVAGTGATLAVSIGQGADVVRVHDVAEAVQVVRVTDAIMRPGLPLPPAL
jgi:dihydropteroate synthase